MIDTIIPHAMEAEKAQSNFNVMLNMVVDNGEMVQIVAKNGNAFLVREDDFRGMLETMYLNSIPGLVESIKAADAEPDEECIRLEEINWDEI